MWDGVGVESKIESVGEVCETEWPNVLKVSDANAIRSCGVVVIIFIIITSAIDIIIIAAKIYNALFFIYLEH